MSPHQAAWRLSLVALTRPHCTPCESLAASETVRTAVRYRRRSQHVPLSRSCGNWLLVYHDKAVTFSLAVLLPVPELLRASERRARFNLCPRTRLQKPGAQPFCDAHAAELPKTLGGHLSASCRLCTCLSPLHLHVVSCHENVPLPAPSVVASGSQHEFSNPVFKDMRSRVHGNSPSLNIVSNPLLAVANMFSPCDQEKHAEEMLPDVGSYVLVWNVIPAQYVDVIKKVEELRYDENEYIGEGNTETERWKRRRLDSEETTEA